MKNTNGVELLPYLVEYPFATGACRRVLELCKCLNFNGYDGVESVISGPNGLVRISQGFRALMRRVEWRGRAARSDALVCGVSLGHGGGEGWFRGRDSVRGFGTRMDRMDGMDLIDLIDLIDASGFL